MRFTLLGTGTSTGVPMPACSCTTCVSTNPKDSRLRPSLLIESSTTTIVIDTSSDFRQQMLTYKVKKLDAVVFTHYHFDHIGGFDDIRPFNFVSESSMPIYANNRTFQVLQSTFPYAFSAPEQEGGGVPQIEQIEIGTEKYVVGDIEVVPIPMMHGVIPVLGFRVGNFAYCTDTNYIPDSSKELLQDLDVLILDALRYHKHPTHFTVDEAIEVALELKPKKTFFTHIAHQILHEDLDSRLPDSMQLAFDGLSIELDE